MGISAINREAVLASVAEFDRIGRDIFLRKYGFGRAKSCWLLYEGKRYDAKAIVGAAHGYAEPTVGPLMSRKFAGGDGPVTHRLRALGFIVELAGKA